MRRARFVPAVVLLASGLACSSSGAPGTQLVVRGSAGAPPPTAPRQLSVMDSVTGPTANPAHLWVSMYALYISPNADCSSPILVQDYGSTAAVRDMALNPVLFSGTPPAGAYPCLAFRMSDVLRMEPDSTFGNCVVGTQYSGDIYREGETDWLDLDLNPIIGSGTDSMPVDDHVTIIITRDTAAAMARGFSPHQLVGLISDLIVPGQSTFYWNGQGTVVDQGGNCGINPGQPEFR